MASTIRKGARALVTGARTGLGRAFATALAESGLHVTGTTRGDRSDDGMPPGVEALTLDFAGQGVEAFLEAHTQRLSEVDVLVNNAGSGVFGPFEEIEADWVRDQFEVLAVAPIRLAQAVFPAMRARGHGAIVNVSSLAAEFPIPCMSLYSAAKAGLSQATRSLALEARGTGVAVIDLQLGDYCTGFNAAMQRTGGASGVRAAKVWDRLEAHLRRGPPPGAAAEALVRALRRNRSGTVRCGNWSQAGGAPLLRRLFGDSFLRAVLARYYRLDS